MLMSVSDFLSTAKYLVFKCTKLIHKMPHYLKFLLVILVVVWYTQAQETSKPNILFILADDLGFNDVSWHNPGIHMPNIERLAKDGLILEQSYVQPVCTPTRAALMSGKYPYTIGRQSGALKPLRPTGLDLNYKILPQVLKEGGYDTHIVGKWHLGFCKWEYTPTYRGFDSFFGFYAGSQTYYTHLKKESLEGRKVTGYDFRNNTDIFHPPEEEYSAFSYSKRAQEIINYHNSKDPFFMYLSLQSVHGPLEVPQEYVDLYSGVADIGRRTYLGMVTAMDDAVGAVVRSLKDKGIFDNTIIVFTTDNGGAKKTYGNNWPLAGHKGTLYEGGIRGPAFIHYPKLRRSGEVHRGLFHVVDWLPTLATAAGVTYPPVDGLDQWADLEGTKTTPTRTKVIFNLKGKGGKLRTSVREGDFKLTIGERKGREWNPPMEGSNFKIKKRTMQRFENQIRATRGSFFLQTSATRMDDEPKMTNTTLLDRFFLPFTDDEDDDQEDEVSDSRGILLRSMDCNGKSKKECRKLRKEVFVFEQFTRVKDFFKYGLKFELYNLKDDPSEEHNIFSRNSPIVTSLLTYLLKELKRAVPEDNPPRDPLGNPANFGGVFSPGWC